MPTGPRDKPVTKVMAKGGDEPVGSLGAISIIEEDQESNVCSKAVSSLRRTMHANKTETVLSSPEC